MSVSETIYAQLGGHRFMIMTGAKWVVARENGIELSLPRTKNGANRLQVTLTGTDLYDVFFLKITNARFGKNTVTAPSTREIEVIRGVYAHDLVRIFEDRTGLFTKL